MKKSMVFALGGNAIQSKGERGTYEEAYGNVYRTMESLLPLFLNPDYQVVLTHGNGPQVGTLLIQQNGSKDKVPAMPMFMCGAMTQGQVGYLIQQAAANLFRKNNIALSVATLVTQVVVDAAYPGFANPSKPVGPFYSKEEVGEMRSEHPDYVFKEDSGRGFRRVVASPKPIRIVEMAAVHALMEKGMLVVTNGGGGIPVIEYENGLTGVDAVIDKDRAASLLAHALDASMLIILTNVDQVALYYGQSDEMWLSSLTITECQTYLGEKHFADGSMGPKIEAAMEFVGIHPERRALITSSTGLTDALAHKNGTWIHA